MVVVAWDVTQQKHFLSSKSSCDSRAQCNKAINYAVSCLNSESWSTGDHWRRQSTLQPPVIHCHNDVINFSSPLNRQAQISGLHWKTYQNHVWSGSPTICCIAVSHWKIIITLSAVYNQCRYTRRVVLRNSFSGKRMKKSCQKFLEVTIRYDMIRDAILTCARKPTWVNLIYRTELTTK